MRTSRPERRPRGGRLLGSFAGLLVLGGAWLGPVPEVVAQPMENDEQAQAGHLIALSSPEGAYVYVDGLLLGRTPIRSVALTPGAYTIWFRSNPPRSFEPEPLAERTFEIVAGDSILVHEDMGSIVRLESIPPGAEVALAGRPIGRTPMSFRWHPKRTGDVRILLEGHRPRRVAEDRLRRGGTIVTRLSGVPGAGDVLGEPVMASRSRVNWKAWGSLTLGATAAAVAVHVKSQADDAYDRYLEAALPADQERHLDESNRLDRVAALSWIVAEGGFVAALYFFAKGVLAMDEAPTPIVAPHREGARVGMQLRY